MLVHGVTVPIRGFCMLRNSQESGTTIFRSEQIKTSNRIIVLSSIFGQKAIQKIDIHWIYAIIIREILFYLERLSGIAAIYPVLLFRILMKMSRV